MDHMTSGLGGLASFFKEAFATVERIYSVFSALFRSFLASGKRFFYRLQAGGIAPISPVLARYKLHYFFLCHDVYSKKVTTISHLNLMLAISYLLSYCQKDNIFCS